MDEFTVQEALPIFYQNYRLKPDGGVDDSIVTIELFKGLNVYIPNFDERKKVVLKHDIHHLLTGYTAVMKGETEISAWELSTGCYNNWAAFTINLYGMLVGIPFNLKGVWRAWKRGMRSRNLYHKKHTIEKLLSRKVGDLKIELGLTDRPQEQNSVLAFLTFTGFLVFSIAFVTLTLVLVPLALLFTIYIHIRKLWPAS